MLTVLAVAGLVRRVAQRVSQLAPTALRHGLGGAGGADVRAVRGLRVHDLIAPEVALAEGGALAQLLPLVLHRLGLDLRRLTQTLLLHLGSSGWRRRPDSAKLPSEQLAGHRVVMLLHLQLLAGDARRAQRERAL